MLFSGNNPCQGGEIRLDVKKRSLVYTWMCTEAVALWVALFTHPLHILSTSKRFKSDIHLTARQSQIIPVHQVSESNRKMFNTFIHCEVKHTDELCLSSNFLLSLWLLSWAAAPNRKRWPYTQKYLLIIYLQYRRLVHKTELSVGLKMTWECSFFFC